MAQPELGFIHRFVPAAEPVALGGALWPDAALLSPRGQGPRKRMPRFFRHLAEEVFDIDDLKFRTHELARRLWQVRGRAIWVSRQKHCGGGVFERANIASSLMLLHPHLLRAQCSSVRWFLFRWISLPISGACMCCWRQANAIRSLLPSRLTCWFACLRPPARTSRCPGTMADMNSGRTI